MNWIVFLLALWVSAGLESGFSGALQFGQMPIVPSFLLVLLAFVALWARPMDAILAALAIGVLLDSLNLVATADGGHVAIIGPHALAAVIVTRLILMSRGAMLRRSTFTLAVVTLTGAMIVHGLVLALLAVRSSYDQIVIGGLGPELAQRSLSAVVTCVLAIPLGIVLQRGLRPLMGFRQPHSLARSSRGYWGARSGSV